MAPTGITVVTGFLGAGKTTLVNYVLQADHGYRVAVILNEFGAELGVEKMLVQGAHPDGDAAVEEWVEMNNGCVCCTVKGSLIQTIDSLLEKRKRSGKPPFDFILLETTGLADPGPVAQELWVDDELLEDDDASAVLDAVVTLVDASNIARQLGEHKEAALQIAYADTVVLNKADLVSDADLDAAERAIAAVNAEARVVRATRSVVDLGLVLNQGAVTVAGRRGKKPVLGGVAAVAPERVLRQGAGFWAKGVEKLAPQESAAVAASCLRRGGAKSRRADAARRRVRGGHGRGGVGARAARRGRRRRGRRGERRRHARAEARRRVAFDTPRRRGDDVLIDPRSIFCFTTTKVGAHQASRRKGRSRFIRPSSASIPPASPPP